MPTPLDTAENSPAVRFLDGLSREFALLMLEEHADGVPPTPETVEAYVEGCRTAFRLSAQPILQTLQAAVARYVKEP